MDQFSMSDPVVTNHPQSPIPIGNTTSNQPTRTSIPPAEASSPSSPRQQQQQQRFTTLPSFSLMYGRPRPPDAPPDVCAACRQSTLTTSATTNPSDPHNTHHDRVVLLCDGYQCHREYHLSCTPWTRVPPDDFYCPDCHPVGARVEALQTYLEQHMDQREDIMATTTTTTATDNPHKTTTALQTAVWKALLTQDVKVRRQQSPRRRYHRHRAPPKSPPKRPGRGSSWSPAAAKTEEDNSLRIPRSELHRPYPWRALSSSSGGQNSSNSNDPSRPRDDDDGSYMGCPVRLYLPALNDYVTGRIVDYDRTTTNTDDSGVVPQHYVRFPAGTTDHKRTVTAWMILEEHALLVNTTGVVVTAGRPTNTREPSSLSPPRHDPADQLATAWVRTSRELLSLDNLATSNLAYYETDESPWNYAGHNNNSNSNQPSPTWVLVKNFGAKKDSFGFANALQLSDMDPNAKYPFLDERIRSLAQAECLEKKRARDWYALGSSQPRIATPYGGTRKRDVDECDPLDPRPRVKPFSLLRGRDVQPCAAVRPGLDRTYLAQRLQRQGIMTTPVDRDLATQLSCHAALPFYYATSGKKIK